MFFHNFIVAPGGKAVFPNGDGMPNNFIIEPLGSPLNRIKTLREAIAAAKNGEFNNCYPKSGVCTYANSVIDGPFGMDNMSPTTKGMFFENVDWKADFTFSYPKTVLMI